MDYEVQIDKSPKEIIEQINTRLKLQNQKSTFFSSNLVDYRKFEINQNKITIEKWPSIFDPFGGIGTISLNMLDSKQGSNIKVNIETYAKYGFIFVFILFVIMTIPILIISYKDLFKTGLLLIICWTIIFSLVYFSSKLNRNRLENYTQTILNDLKREY